MLDNPHQLAAYKLLQTTPVHTAASITTAAAVSTAAAAKATALGALKSATVTYPASITAQVTLLTSWVTLITRAKTVCDTFKTTITPYQDINEMIELYTGWQVYLKVNNLAATTNLRTNDAVADTTKVAALKTAIDALSFTALTTAWHTINTALTPPPPAAGGAGTGATTNPVTPTLSQAQIDALATAMTTATPTYTALKTKIDAVEALTNNAKNDAAHATDAYTRAVTVAILTNVAGNGVLTNSLKAIISAGVYTELQAANANA